MKDFLLELISSYESKVLTGVELIVATYHATFVCDQDLNHYDEARERLKERLQDTLAKNCFLRKKDFVLLVEGIFTDLDNKRREIEEQRKETQEKLDEYLKDQKQLAFSLREKVEEFNQGKEDKSNIENVIDKIKNSYQDRGEQVLDKLRSFQSRLSIFLHEQEEMNHTLQRLLDRGKLLNIDDVRQLEGERAHQERMSERNMRRGEVEGMLSQFRQKRERSSHQT